MMVLATVEVRAAICTPCGGTGQDPNTFKNCVACNGSGQSSGANPTTGGKTSIIASPAGGTISAQDMGNDPASLKGTPQKNSNGVPTRFTYNIDINGTYEGGTSVTAGKHQIAWAWTPSSLQIANKTIVSIGTPAITQVTTQTSSGKLTQDVLRCVMTVEVHPG